MIEGPGKWPPLIQPCSSFLPPISHPAANMIFVPLLFIESSPHSNTNCGQSKMQKKKRETENEQTKEN
ncbi:hypothetical protein EYC84_004504 [Monilinia fructicola]|uniref:Uncharacterized protein n=1 Tax=Monilinia fructicola TaxID=38448 RepID=A0A5M9K5N1_MONFR|nr:hypothetical protein EYC84_004504 [Monilinia fructicola]